MQINKFEMYKVMIKIIFQIDTLIKMLPLMLQAKKTNALLLICY